MFLDTCQTARESLTDEEAFLALELAVLDDFVAYKQGDARSLRNEHLQYLAALHFRGEDGLGLELIDRVLDSAADALPAAIGTVSPAELFLLKASMLAETGAPADAETVLRCAAETSRSPQISGEIAIRLARILVGDSREAEALAVLQDTHDSLTPGTRTADLVTSLAAAYAAVKDYGRAEQILRLQILQLAPISASPEPDESALCRVHLASLLLGQGKCTEIEDLLGPVHTSAVAQPLINLSWYLTAVSTAVNSGSLLSECLRASPFLSQLEGQDNSFPLFRAFTWLRPGLASKDKIAREAGKGLASGSTFLAGLFRLEELDLQGSAYRRLAEGDFAGAIDDFQSLEKLRIETGCPGNLMAALDMNALAFALGKAGRSGALDAARSARRRLQLLIGLSSTGTLRALLDEARILMDLDEPGAARALVRPALTHAFASDDGQEVILRLRLVLMEIYTRTGLANESLQSISALESEAAAFQFAAPDLLPIVKYQAAAAKAAAGDFDAAEHEFAALRRALVSAEVVNHELVLKATYGLARVMQRRGEYAHALALLEPLLETSPKMSRPMSLRVRRRIAACYSSLHEHQAAADMYRSCAEDLSEWAGEKAPDYLNMRLSQADCLRAAGHYQPASAMYQVALDAMHPDYSGQDSLYIRSMVGNATSLRRLHDYRGAAHNYRQVHDLPARAQHMSPEATLDLEKWLAWSLEMSGETDAAVQHYAEAIRLLQELHPDRIDLLGELQFRLLCCSE